MLNATDKPIKTARDINDATEMDLEMLVNVLDIFMYISISARTRNKTIHYFSLGSFVLNTKIQSDVSGCGNAFVAGSMGWWAITVTAHLVSAATKFDANKSFSMARHDIII